MGMIAAIVGYLKIPYQVLHFVTALVAIGGPIFYYRYKSAIERRKNKLKEKLARGLVYRDTVSKPERVIKALELHSSFKEAHSSSCQMCSMGEYLSTLRFFTDKDDDDDNNDNEGSSTTRANILEKELYVVIASMLMKAFGDTVGAALLPVMGMKPAESMFETLASKMVSYTVAKFFVKSNKDWDPTKDLAAMPLNVSELMR